ncbi:MAG: hypothetical protein Q4P24_07935 [Rhodobacterales bacterium]|nr:hypothetical protein [Rhodobacterales bacterium]
MPRWMFFAPMIALVGASAVIGLSLGRKAMRGNETDVIVQVAARYVAEAGRGALLTDCTARPATSRDLWLVVTCIRPGGQGREYFIDRFGGVRQVDILNPQTGGGK